MTEKKKKPDIVKIIMAVIIAVLIAAVVLLLGDRNKKAKEESESAAAESIAEETDPVTPENFVFSPETSKIFFKADDKDTVDVTENVTAYNRSEVCLDEKGIEKVFGVAVTSMTDEEKEQFVALLSENNRTADEAVKFSDGKTTLIIGIDTNCCSVNGSFNLLSSPAIRLSGRLSIPVYPEFPFFFGFKTAGCSVKADTVTYTMHK